MISAMDNYTNEQTVIGAILIEPSCLTVISSILSPDDFASDVNRTIYRQILELSLSGETIDPFVVADRLRGVTTAEQLIAAMQLTPTARNAAAYADLVHKAAKLRRLEELALQMLDDAKSGVEPDAIAAYVYSALDNDGDSSVKILSSSQAVDNFVKYRTALDEAGAEAIVKSNIPTLDNLLGGGFTRGELHIIAARPGVGKTTFAVGLIDTIASRGLPSLMISLEMNTTQITAKRFTYQTGIEFGRLINGKMDGTAWKLLGAGAAVLTRQPVYTIDKTGMTVNDIALAARRVKGLRYIVIDYLGYIKPPYRREKRHEEYAEVSNELKMMARTLNIPVICLAQLNRENEQRGNKRPRLSDLRETGMIEQDAASVIFLHRNGAYNTSTEEAEEMELIVAKSRYGRQGIAPVIFYGQTGKFYEKSGREYGA